MTRHILVVDDNDDVRDVIVGMLIENGFVATAADGGVAMRNVLAAAGGIPIDAIVLDSLMPGKASEALAFHANTTTSSRDDFGQPRKHGFRGQTRATAAP
jgi:CheY-like chemotaxis protein